MAALAYVAIELPDEPGPDRWGIVLSDVADAEPARLRAVALAVGLPEPWARAYAGALNRGNVSPPLWWVYARACARKATSLPGPDRV
jgi:hypothetical protein